MRNRILLSALVMGLGITGSAFAAAETVNGKQNLVCAAIDVVACTEGPTCVQGASKTFDLPVFLFVDFKGKVVHATEDDGGKKSSPIMNMTKTESQVILQGVENHRGWTIAVGRASGNMTVSSSGPDLSFMVMGACTAK